MKLPAWLKKLLRRPAPAKPAPKPNPRSVEHKPDFHD
jgi:hypothetical protein